MADGQGTKRIDIAAAVETSDAAPRFKESSEDGGKLPYPIPNVHLGNTQSAFMHSADHRTGLKDLTGQEEPPSPVAAPQDPSDTAHHEVQQPGTVRENDMVIRTVKQVKKEMLEEGWCPHQINYLSRRYGLEALELISKEYEDRELLRPEDHDLCSGRQSCIAYNAAPPELYKTNTPQNVQEAAAIWSRFPMETWFRLSKAAACLFSPFKCTRIQKSRCTSMRDSSGVTTQHSVMFGLTDLAIQRRMLSPSVKSKSSNSS